jgi:hypothetical protein
MSDAIYRGEQAARILNDPMVQEALGQIKGTLRDMFFDTDPADEKARQMLHMMDRARQQFERYFELLVYNAKVERSEVMAEAHAAARIDAIRRQTLER